VERGPQAGPIGAPQPDRSELHEDPRHLRRPAYGTERSWNGLRPAGSLARRPDVDVRIFLPGDAVGCVVALGQKVPEGYYHLDRTVESAARHGAQAGCCGTCLDARAITDQLLVKGASFQPGRTDRLDIAGRPGDHVLSQDACRQSGHG
jgi:uncharacterized protein involved in oxidation of intracellular sulfur